MSRLGFFVFAILSTVARLAWAEPVATVSRLVGDAEITQPHPGVLTQGADVSVGDAIVTKNGARLELRFVDGMDLILGENAHLVIDRLIYDPTTATGQATLQIPDGAFRVITGAIAKLPDHPFQLTTPYASVGVRGTDFWGGPLDDPFAMVAIAGSISITTPTGTAILTPGQGIEIRSLGGPPSFPHPWSADKTARALKTVDFPN